MENTHEYNAASTLCLTLVIKLAVKEGSGATSHKLDFNQPMVKSQRRQQEELRECKKTTKAYSGHKDAENGNFGGFFEEEEDKDSDE